MRLTNTNGALLAAAGMLAVMSAATAGAQSTNPNQNSVNPPASNPTGNAANYPGQGNLNNGNPNVNTGTGTGAVGTPGSGINETGAMSSMGAGSDLRFAKQAAIGCMTEVKLGKLAVEKSSSDKVKQFGQRMVDDHTKAGDELKAIAAKHKMILPGDVDSKHQAVIEKFSAMSGDQFDQAYVKAMVKDHDQDIMEFQNEANNGTNADLRSWAGKTLPTVQEHEHMIKQIRSGLNSKMTRN